MMRFDGGIDAAGAATACANHVAGEEPIASFDVDSLNDYRARRPVLDVVDGVLAWMRHEHRPPARGGRRRDLLVLVGPEPDYKWKQLGDDVRELRSGSASSNGSVSARSRRPCRTRVQRCSRPASRASLRDGERQGRAGSSGSQPRLCPPWR